MLFERSDRNLLRRHKSSSSLVNASLTFLDLPGFCFRCLNAIGSHFVGVRAPGGKMRAGPDMEKMAAEKTWPTRVPGTAPCCHLPEPVLKPSRHSPEARQYAGRMQTSIVGVEPGRHFAGRPVKVAQLANRGLPPKINKNGEIPRTTG